MNSAGVLMGRASRDEPDILPGDSTSVSSDDISVLAVSDCSVMQTTDDVSEERRDEDETRMVNDPIQ